MFVALKDLIVSYRLWHFLKFIKVGWLNLYVAEKYQRGSCSSVTKKKTKEKEKITKFCRDQQ